MRATIEFALPEDKYELDNALCGDALRRVVEELLEHLRWRLKGEGLTAEAVAVVEEIQALVIESCHDRNVRLD